MKFKVEYVGINPEGQEITELRNEIINPSKDHFFYGLKSRNKIKEQFEIVANFEVAMKERGYRNVVRKVSKI